MRRALRRPPARATHVELVAQPADTYERLTDTSAVQRCDTFSNRTMLISAATILWMAASQHAVRWMDGGSSGTGKKEDPSTRIMKLKGLRDAGAITEAEFNKKKAKLLHGLVSSLPKESIVTDVEKKKRHRS